MQPARPSPSWGAYCNIKSCARSLSADASPREERGNGVRVKHPDACGGDTPSGVRIPSCLLDTRAMPCSRSRLKPLLFMAQQTFSQCRRSDLMPGPLARSNFSMTSTLRPIPFPGQRHRRWTCPVSLRIPRSASKTPGVSLLSPVFFFLKQTNRRPSSSMETRPAGG